MSDINIYKHSDICWSFNSEKPYIFCKMSKGWGHTEYVDPFPGYTHNLELAKSEIEYCEKTIKLRCFPSWHILPFEGTCRTNGTACRNDQYSEKTIAPWIILAGKRIPILPAMTRYLVSHEYGHIVHGNIEYFRGMERDDFLKEYAEVRGITMNQEYGAGKWHLNTGEVIANDIRILLLKRETEFWPHEVPHPSKVPALKKYWLNQIKNLNSYEVSTKP